MMKWEIRKLGDVCEFFNGQAHEKCIDENGKYKVINSKFISSEGLIYKKTNIALSPLVKNDIVLCMSDVPNGKTIAKCFLVDKNDTYTLNQRICVIRSTLFDAKFLYYQLNRNKYFLSFDNGENQTNLRKDDILNCGLLLPPLPEQQRIVAILDEVFDSIAKAKANAEKNLKNAQELFESYLQSVFENKGEDWMVKKLIDVCIVERGSSPRPIDKYTTNDEDGVNWIKIGDTKGVDKYIFSTREKITKEGALKSRYVKEGDFILSNSMSFGRPYIMKTNGYIHDGWFVLRLHDFINTEFFYHLLSSPLVNEQFHKLASGSVVKNISGDLVKKVILPIPPLAEQQTIVQKLDALSLETKKLETIYRTKIADLEELKKSILHKAFSGELK